MGTPSLRIRLEFEDRSILSKRQRSDGMNHCWLLLKLQQHRTISDVCTHLLHIFKLHRSCPNGILLSMEGFALPAFESTEILKEKEIICVKKKGGSTPDPRDLLDDVLESGDDDMLHIENDNLNKVTEAFQGESEEVDEDQSQDEELPEETISKKRKVYANLQCLKKKKQCLEVLGTDEDEAETEETENINNDASHPMKIISTKETKKMAPTSNKKVKAPSTVKRSEELQRNVEEVNKVTNARGAKKPLSRTLRRAKNAKRKRELAKITKKKPQQVFSKPEKTKPINKEANDQPKGLLYWKQASKKPLENTDVSPVVTRPGHIRFESLDEDQTAEQIGVSTEKIKWNGSSSKKTDQECGSEKLSTFGINDHPERINQESFKAKFKDSKVPVMDPNDFGKLPPCSEPKEGDVIAYRLLELTSSWIAELSSFRVGRISYYDAKDIVLVPVTEYPILSEKINKDGPDDSLYGEDGTLEINYSALVDVRSVKQYDLNATEPLSVGVDQTPLSHGKDATENLVSNSNNATELFSVGVDQIPVRDDKDAAENLVSNSNDNNMDVPKDSNSEIPEPNNLSVVGSGPNPSSHDGAGPSTSTGPDTNKAESSDVHEGDKGNPIDPCLDANKLNQSQENNSGWSSGLGPAANHCENGSSWGRPWSAFVVSRVSSVIQQNEENKWHAGSSRASWNAMSRAGPRGRGRGRGRGRNGN